MKRQNNDILQSIHRCRESSCEQIVVQHQVPQILQLGKIKRGLLCLLLLPILLKELKSIVEAFGQTCGEAFLNLFVRLPLYNDTLG